MSASEVRQALADAAAKVDVSVQPYFKTLNRPGEGTVRLARWLRSENGFGFISQWQVVVLLHSDLANAERWVDEHIPDLVEALAEHMVVTSVTPQQLNVGGQNLPCVVVEGSREAD